MPGNNPGGSDSSTSGSSDDESDQVDREALLSTLYESVEEAKQIQGERGPRLSVKYQSKEMAPSGRMSNSRRSSLPFDRSRIGTYTRHGLMPGPRGHSAAKINQDRGVAHWPYNGSHNEALFCVFDGHGRNGEKVSEFCVKAIPAALQEVGAELRADPPAVLHQTVIEVDKKVLKKLSKAFDAFKMCQQYSAQQ